MRRPAQRVQHGDLDALDGFDHRRRHFFAITQVGQHLFSSLDKQIAVGVRSPMREGQRDDFQIADFERAVHDVRFGNKITPGPRAVVKGVGKDAAQVGHRRRVGIDRQRLVAAQITKAAAVVQPHDVVGVRVGEDHGVEPAQVFTQALDAEFRRGVHDQFDLVRGDINRRPRAMVLGIGEKSRRVILADDGHALRGAGTQKNKAQSHV